MTDIISEEFILPSLGKVYSKQFDPHVKLRSMTVAEEMKRLGGSKTPYKVMSEIIEACLIDKLPISVYDLCMADYTFLLHKLRIVTYGADYAVSVLCPRCGEVQKKVIDLDSLEVKMFDETLKSHLYVTLPKTNKTITLRMQTPRDLDNISLKKEQMKKEFPDMKDDPSLILTMESLISEIDGEPVNQMTLKESLKRLPMMDSNILISAAAKLQEQIGIQTDVETDCEICSHQFKVPFRYTSEFFGPTYD